MRVTPNCDSINSFYICNAIGVQWAPDIAYGAGYYFVAWSDNRTGYYQIYGVRVTPSGTVMEPNGLLIGYGVNPYYYYPQVVFNGTNYFVIWTTGSSPYRLMGRFINPDGSFGSDTLMICNIPNYAYRPRIAFDGNNYLVAWIEYNSIVNNYSIKGQRVSTTGIPVGSMFTIADTVDYNSLSVRFAFSRYIIVFAKQIGIDIQHCGKYYNTSGQPMSGIFNISNTSYNCFFGDVYPGANSRYINVWTENRTNTDIYGNLDVGIGIEEENSTVRNVSNLRSTIVSNAIEFRDRKTSGAVYDVTGKKIGVISAGHFDCRHLASGVYIVKSDLGETFRIIKIE